MIRFFLVLIIISFNVAACDAAAPLPVDSHSNQYDELFRKNSKRQFGVGFGWKWFKAQAVTESALRPEAVSPVGAQGLMQIMPATWKEITGKQPWIKGKVTDPRWNVAAGVYYDRQIYQKWKSERPLNDRLALTFASYNGGFGNVLKGQRQCQSDKAGDCNLWPPIARVAHKVKSWRSEESVNYVARIFKLMGEII